MSKNKEKLPATEDELLGLQAILKHAWDITRWHNARADARDRIATQIVAFTGVLLALMAGLADPISRIEGNCQRVAMSIVAILGAALLVSAVVISLISIARPIRSRPANTAWPQERWLEYREQHPSAAKVLENQIHALVGDPEDSPPYKEIAAAADRREHLTRWSIGLLASGVALLGAVLIWVLIAS